MPKQAKSRPKVIRRCAVCGREFKGGDRKLYCSDECKARANYQKIKLERDRRLGHVRSEDGKLVLHCAVCGREFSAHRGNEKYCSEVCRTEANRRNAKESKKRLRQKKLEAERQQRSQGRQQDAAKERARQELRARKHKKEMQGCPIQVDYFGSCAGYKLDELAAIARANGLSYGKLTGLIACSGNRIPEGITVPEMQKLLVKKRGAQNTA